MASQFGEYATKGDYHINLDTDWPYMPVYVAKMNFIRTILNGVQKNKTILDLGCGEGVLVQELKEQGFNIIGMDLNYENEYVKRGSLLETGFENGFFDVVLCLDVLEHLNFEQQVLAINEIARITKKGGTFIFSIPNLAHFASRLSFLFTGKLIRTSSWERHPGDRPIHEYVKLLKKDFIIQKRVGFFPTFPLISLLTVWKPKVALPVHRLYNSIVGYPNWCFLNILTCTRK